MSSVNPNAGSSKAPYNPTIDFVALAEEFKKYISFIPKFHESFKSHLNVTIVPFFVFIYLSMLKGKRVDIAHRFISRFYMRLHLIDGLPPHINDLVQFKTINEARNHHYFQRFCKVSYQLVIPAKSLILLMETLKVRRCTNLLVLIERLAAGRNDGQNLREAAVTPTNAEGRRVAVEPPAAVASTSRDPPTNHEDIPVDRIPDILVIDLTNSDEDQDVSNYSQSTAASSIVIENTSCRMMEKRKRSTGCTTENLKRKKSTLQWIEMPETSSSLKNTEVKTNHYQVEMIHCTMNYEGLEVVCADIDKRNSLFACGFENSTICVGTFDLAMIRGLVDLKTDYLRRSSPSNVSGTPEHFFITDFGLDHCLTGHSGAITGLAFAPSGLLMSCSDDTTARLWRLSDLRNTCVYRDHGDQIKDIAVSDNEVYFATASIDCTARLWNFERSTALINFRHSHEVEHLRFDPNCRYLATLSARRTIQLWTVEDGRSVWTIPDLDSSDVNCITISPDGKHVAYADSAGFIKVWDLSSRQLYSKGAAHKGPIYHLAYNADNSVIGSLGADRLIKVWSAKKLAPEEPVPKKRDIWMHKNLAKYFAAKFNPCFLFFHERGDILTTINSPLRSESS